MPSLLFFLNAARLAVAVPLLIVSVYPKQALLFEQERILAHQHLAFVRVPGVGKEQVAGAVDYAQALSIPVEVGARVTTQVTAYTSRIEETDNDPFTTASGGRTHLGTLAANWLPMGTRVLIEGQVYTVEDRMNSRYNDTRRIDIWMEHPELAQPFGVRYMEVTIVSLPH